ncbi:MAG TPA: TlpA disulfide reductase family protein, partial [Verrucomicrobiae bacterium]
AFGILRERNDPKLAALAAGQFGDPDQHLRLLGLYQFKYVSPAIAVPTIMPLLDDSNPIIVIKCLNLLEHLTGGKFSVKFNDVAMVDETKAGPDQYKTGGREKVEAAVENAKNWFAQHQAEFPPIDLPLLEKAFSAEPAPDFQLLTVDGKKFQLSDFRGKVVLINFWTTWCTACVSEMPELIALQNKFKDKVVIVGVSLDFVPDDDEPPDAKKLTVAALNEIHDKVVRTIQTRGINYPILLDKQNEVGGYFNGGELPTTVIVDAQGNIRRRFVGARSLPEFEAILAEAGSKRPEDFKPHKP